MSLKILFCYFLSISAAYANEGGLAITVEPNDAEIYLNGQLKANSSPSYLTLSEGKYQIEVKKAGMNSESFEIVVPAEGTVVKKVTLTLVAPTPPPTPTPPAPTVSDIRLDLIALLKPERGKFETEIEFAQRRAKLLVEFNQAVTQHDAQFQIGTATLDYAHYDLDSGTFPVEIELVEWAKPFILPFQRNIAALRDDAQNLWQEGEQKPLFAYFKLGKHVAEVDKIVLVGINKEWRVESVTGHLFVTFPSFLSELSNKLTEAYQKSFPYVFIHPSATEDLLGSLLTGKANLVISHRAMTNEEFTVFTKKFEYEPLEIRIAMNMYAVYVHKDNPLTYINDGLDALFSAGGACTSPHEVYHLWGDFAEKLSSFKADEWKYFPIRLHGAKQGTLTYQWFKENMLCGGEFKPNLQQLDDKKVAIAVSNDAIAIGFARFTDIDPNLSVRALRIYNPRENGYFSSGRIEPTKENALSGKYPLAHYIWVYVNKSPKSELPPVEQEMLRFMLSRDGQHILDELDFITLSQDEYSAERVKF